MDVGIWELILRKLPLLNVASKQFRKRGEILQIPRKETIMLIKTVERKFDLMWIT